MKLTYLGTAMVEVFPRVFLQLRVLQRGKMLFVGSDTFWEISPDSGHFEIAGSRCHV